MDYEHHLDEHLNEHTPLIQTSHVSSSIYRPSDRCSRRLPLVLQVTLGLLGLWSPMRRAKSSQAVLEKDRTPVTVDIPMIMMRFFNIKPLRCDDESPHQHLDKNENRCGYNDDDDDDHQAEEEDQKRCHCSDVFAILYLLTTCCLLTYDFATYLRFYWGKTQDLLHLVSYFTFLFQVMVIPFWCFYARLLYLTLGRRYREGYPLFRSFISTRVTVLTSSRFGSKGLSWFRLLCFLAWPVTNAILRFANGYLFPGCPNQAIYKELTHWAAFLGYIFYCCFCYLMHIERISFECEVREISVFARKQASDINVDAVRRRISEFFLRYNMLRRLIRFWMAFTMVVATWGLTAHMTWNYLVFSDTDIDDSKIAGLHFLNILVSSQKIMFFFVPCVAIGGLNLEHVWKRFKYEIARNRQYVNEAYWTAINRYLYEINVDHSYDLTPTLIFSAIGFYLGLNLGSGDQQYKEWNIPYDCNASRPFF